MIKITVEDRLKVCRLYVKYGKILKSDLRACGFTDARIDALIWENVVIESCKNEYTLHMKDVLYSHALDELAKNNIPDALRAYQMYYEEYPMLPISNYGMFIKCVIEGEYTCIENYLDGFIRPSTDKMQNNDYNFYLYLLSFIIDLSEPYKQRVSKMKYEDITVGSRTLRRLASVRAYVYYNQDFSRALKELEKEKERRASDILLKSLLEQASLKQRAIAQNMSDLIRDKDYKNLVTLLEREEQKHGLKITWACVLTLAKDILWMKRTGVPIIASNKGYADIYTLVKRGDYSQAKYLNQRIVLRKKRGQMRKDLDAILTEATTTRDYMFSKLKVKRTRRLREEKISIDIPITQMIVAFRSSQIDEGYAYAWAIINNLSLNEFDYLIIDSIKLCLELGDDSLIKPLTIINKLSLGNKSIDVEEYVKEFDYFIEVGNIEAAKICCEVITYARRYGHIVGDNEEILRLLEHMRETLERKKKVQGSSMQKKKRHKVRK